MPKIKGVFFWDVFPTYDVPEIYFGCSFHLTPFSKALKYTPKCGKIRQMLYLTCPSEHAVQREGVIFGQNAFSNISSCQTPYTQYRETIENSLNPGSDEEAWFVTTHSYAFLWHHHHSLANLNRPD